MPRLNLRKPVYFYTKDRSEIDIYQSHQLLYVDEDTCVCSLKNISSTKAPVAKKFSVDLSECCVLNDEFNMWKATNDLTVAQSN